MRPLTLRYPERSFWHLLFPLGGSEQVTRKGARGSVVFEQAFDGEWCSALIRSFRAYMVASAKMGSEPQPRPVSVEHVIVSKMLGQQTDADPARSGDVVALHFLTESTDGTPAGVYGLIQWRTLGADGPSDDRRPYLSPTTKAKHTMRDGTVITGPFLFEIGVVSLPALETIGSTHDRLPLSAFQVPDYVIAKVAPVIERAYIATPSPGLIMRGATMLEEAPMLDEETVAKIREMVGEMLAECEERTYRRAMEAMDERMKERAVATPTMQPETPPAAEPESLIDRAAKLQRAAAEVESLELVTARRLLARDADKFVSRRMTGDSVDELVGDFGRLSVPQGVSGSVPGESPTKRSVSQSVIVNEATLRMVETGGDLLALVGEIRADYMKRNYTVEV